MAPLEPVACIWQSRIKEHCEVGIVVYEHLLSRDDSRQSHSGHVVISSTPIKKASTFLVLGSIFFSQPEGRDQSVCSKLFRIATKVSLCWNVV